jgi:hypothetical protein
MSAARVMPVAARCDAGPSPALPLVAHRQRAGVGASAVSMNGVAVFRVKTIAVNPIIEPESRMVRRASDDRSQVSTVQAADGCL